MQLRATRNKKLRDKTSLFSFHTKMREQLGAEYTCKIAPFIDLARSEFSRCGCAVITANRLLKKLPSDMRDNIEITRLAMCAAFDAANEHLDIPQAG